MRISSSCKGRSSEAAPILIVIIWLISVLFSEPEIEKVVSAGKPPSRIVSLNLAADELILSLAGRDRIAALSLFSTDESVSFCAEEASKVPARIAASLEQIESLNPDALIISPYSTPIVFDYFVRKRGIPCLVYQEPRTFSELKQAIIDVGKFLGEEKAASDIAKAFEVEIDRIPPPKGKYRALVVQSFLNAKGGGSMINDALAISSIENVIKEEGIVSLSVERFLSVRCDYIVTTKALAERLSSDRFTSRHPAVAGAKFIIVEERSLNSINHNIVYFVSEVRRAVDALERGGS